VGIGLRCRVDGHGLDPQHLDLLEQRLRQQPSARVVGSRPERERTSVDVLSIHERDGRYMATADLGEDSRDVGVGDAPQEAVKEALRSLGEPYASEMAESLSGDRGTEQNA
jgi:hypothetical protein